MTVSVAITAMSIFLGCVLYRLIQAIRELEIFFGKLNQVSSEAGEWLTRSKNRLLEVPILAYFLKKRTPKGTKKA